MRQENSKIVQQLMIQIRELQEQHNRLTTRVLLLQNELVKVKRHTEYVEPQLTQDEVQRRQAAIQEFKHGVPGGQPQGMPQQRSLRTIDN